MVPRVDGRPGELIQTLASRSHSSRRSTSRWQWDIGHLQALAHAGNQVLICVQILEADTCSFPAVPTQGMGSGARHPSLSLSLIQAQLTHLCCSCLGLPTLCLLPQRAQASLEPVSSWEVAGFL